MQILPFLSKKGVDVYDHEDLQEAAVDLGVITAEQSMWTRDPAFTTPAMLIALWKRVKDLEEAVKVLQEGDNPDADEPADEPKARCCPSHREPGEARYGCATAPGVTDPCCNDCHYWVAWNRYLDGDDDDEPAAS